MTINCRMWRPVERGYTLIPRTGCYSATSVGPLARNHDSGCYTGCYKPLHRVLHSGLSQLSRIFGSGPNQLAERRFRSEGGSSQIQFFPPGPNHNAVWKNKKEMVIRGAFPINRKPRTGFGVGFPAQSRLVKPSQTQSNPVKPTLPPRPSTLVT